MTLAARAWFAGLDSRCLVIQDSRSDVAGVREILSRDAELTVELPGIRADVPEDRHGPSAHRRPPLRMCLTLSSAAGTDPPAVDSLFLISSLGAALFRRSCVNALAGVMG